MLSDNDTQDVLIVDNEDVDFVVRTGAEQGVSVQRADLRGVEPVLTTTLVLFGTATAVALVSGLVERHRGGQVIDLRPHTPKPIYRSRDVVFGLVVIYAVDGRVTVDVKEPAGMFGQVLDSLTAILGDLVGAGVADVAATVTERISDAATVTTETGPTISPPTPHT